MNYLNQALRISIRMGDKEIQKAAYDKLSVAYTFHGNYPEAISCIEKAIKLAEEAGNTSEAKKSSLNLGIIYKYQGNFVKALEVFLMAVPYFEETEDKDMLISLDNCIGGIYLHQKDYSEALKYLNSALEFSRDRRMKPDEASNLSSIGLVYHGMQQYAEALHYELQALNIYTEIDDKEGIAGTCLIIGETYEGKGDTKKALESFYKSLKVCEENNYNLNKVSCLIAIGNIMIRQATHSDPAESALKYKKARGYLMESLDLAMIMDQKDHLMNIYKSLYRIDSASRNYSGALENYKLYSRYRDSLYNVEGSNQMAGLQVQFVREQKNQEIMLLTKENEIKATEIKWQTRQRNGILVTAALILLAGFLVIRSKRITRKLEKQQAVTKERERISADLHDDIGSGLSKIILMLEVLNREAESQDAQDKTRAISEESLELSKSMSEVIWALNSRNDYLESLLAYIRKYAGSYFENSTIRFTMTAPAHVPQTHLSSEQRRNIFYAVKEALHNIVKHAKATEAEVMIAYENQIISIIIRDNGIGMHDGALNRFGNGIIQMRTRLQSIGGEFSIETGDGTTIRLALPV